MATVTISETPAITVGDAVVALIAAQTWRKSATLPSLNFTPRRVYQVGEYAPYDKTLRVDLIVAEQEKEIEDRGIKSMERRFNAVIGVQKIVADKNDVAEVDDLVNFVGAISDFFEFEVEIAIGSQKIRCTDNRIAPVCNPQELDQNSRFFGLIHLTFAGWYDG